MRSRLLSATALVAVLLVGACAPTADADAIEEWMLQTMARATDEFEETGAYPRGHEQLGEYEDTRDAVALTQYLTDRTAQQLCIQVSTPDAKYALYSADPTTVVDGSCEISALE